MNVVFSENVYRGYIIKGDLTGAIQYVKQFPDQSELYNRFMEVFEKEQYITYDADAELNEILTIYQQYYRDVFYLCMEREKAADRLKEKLAECLGTDGKDITLDEMEEQQVATAFISRGFHFLGGRTSGYYGPYIWRTTETKNYEVELPDGIQRYTVKLLDGFISQSWASYLSFGRTGTGGWSDGDGIINCIKSSYDLESEAFKVSLLKHEAQHARDLSVNKNMSSEDLEYRAKLVELIYSSQRNLLGRFIQEADNSDRSNGHAAASERIIDGFVRKLNLDRAEVEKLPNRQIQAVAEMLFEESDTSQGKTIPDSGVETVNW